MPGQRGREIAWMTAVSVVVKYVHTFRDGVARRHVPLRPLLVSSNRLPVFMIREEVGPKMQNF